MFTRHDERTDNYSRFKLNFIELTYYCMFSFWKYLIVWKQNKQINIAVRTGISASLRTIKNGLSLRKEFLSLFLDTIYYLWSFHAAKIQFFPICSKLLLFFLL